MILDVDAGNTALKWRLSNAEKGIVARGRSVYGDDQLFCNVAKQFPAINMVRLSSVAKPELDAFIASYVLQLWGIPVVVAKTKSSFAGLTVAYKNANRLGVDRWLAMLAARDIAEGAVCIVDCGSAITVDMVDAGGLHQGGYIVPGLAMQRKTLLNSTGQIRIEHEVEQASVSWGRNTEEAISFGVLQMAVSFIDAIVDRFAEGRESVALFLTGGDAAVLRPLLKSGERFYEHPELVMDGLVVALPQAD